MAGGPRDDSNGWGLRSLLSGLGRMWPARAKRTLHRRRRRRTNAAPVSASATVPVDECSICCCLDAHSLAVLRCRHVLLLSDSSASGATAGRSIRSDSGDTAASTTTIPRGVCESCQRRHLRTELVSKRRSTVWCPCGCNAVWDAPSVKMADLEMSVLMLSNEFEAWARSEPSYRVCPNPECGVGALYDASERAPIIACAACGTRSCYLHRCRWPEDRGCDECAAAEANSDAYKQKHTKPCPKCGVPIEKQGGCSHMQCLQCLHHFCWQCLADHKEILMEGNHRHHPFCPLYH